MAGFPFCPLPPSRCGGGATGDFGGAGFLVGGTETAAAAGAVAEADRGAEGVGGTEDAGEGAAEPSGVRVGLALGEGVAAAGVAGGFPSDLPDPEQPAAASPSTTSSADTPRSPRLRIIPAPSKTIMR
ncbi:hypothetical protein OG912_03840 [Streptomyces sp. NBC_00464]|uniref:hypothetical protein n=1 Tax=Streptomyces sp. NBC_00464 TaxID=2975751 RepID=UPI002E1988DF